MTSNIERLNLSGQMAQRFAEHHGVLVVTWDLPATGGLIDRLASEEGVRGHTMESGLVGIFVEGGPAHLTENIHPALGLANGSFVRMHSLSFTNQTPREANDLQILLNNGKPGEILSSSCLIAFFFGFSLTYPVASYIYQCEARAGGGSSGKMACLLLPARWGDCHPHWPAQSEGGGQDSNPDWKYRIERES